MENRASKVDFLTDRLVILFFFFFCHDSISIKIKMEPGLPMSFNTQTGDTFRENLIAFGMD